MEGPPVVGANLLEQYIPTLEKAQDDPTNVMLLAVVAQGLRLCQPLRVEIAKYRRVVQNIAVSASKGAFFVHLPITLQPYDGKSPSMTRGPVRIYPSQVDTQKVVVKELHLGNKQEQESAQLSLALMSVLSHPNLQASVGADLTSSALRTATTLCESGNLREFIGVQPKNESMQMPIIIETANALRFLHSCGLVHANLKPENVLIWWPRPSSSGSLITVTDYGSKPSFGTSLEFFAPEVLNGAAASEASDVFSLGMLAWMVLSWRSPEKRNPTPAELAELKQRLLANKLPPISAEWPAHIRRMIKNCRADARDRPSASDLLLIHLETTLEKERAGRKQAELALQKASDRVVELEAELKLAKFGKRIRAGSVPPSPDKGGEANSELTTESQLLRLGATLTKMKSKLHEWRVSETALQERK